MFGLLKAGSPAPVQVRAPAGRETGFSLRNVSASASGNYSCVYSQARAPFLTSEASPHLELWVAGKVPRDLRVFSIEVRHRLIPWLSFLHLLRLFVFFEVDSFTSFWPHWASVAAPGLTLVARAGLCRSVRASHCRGFSPRRPRALRAPVR